MYANTSVKNSSSSTMDSENVLKELHKPTMGARATDSARIMKFTRELSGATVVLGILNFLPLFMHNILLEVRLKFKLVCLGVHVGVY